MAKLSYADVSQNQQNNSQNQKTEWFALKNNGDQAIVRIMEDSLEGLEILTIHPSTLNGKFIKVNCIKDIKDPVDRCPLCASGAQVQQRVFIKLLVYGPDGSVTPKIWERSTAYAKTLKSKMDNYGPLSDHIFIITRCGEAGDIKTTYNIDYAPPAVYPETKYPKDVNAFSNYSVLGNAVFDKNFDELSYFIQNKEFPSKKKSVDVEPDNSVPSYTPTPSNQPVNPPMEPAYTTEQTQNSVPWKQPRQVERPKRYY